MGRLDDVLAQNDPSLVGTLDEAELKRLFWKYKGLRKQIDRDTSFWSSTNDNLKVAYEKLDEQERELNRAYTTIQEDLGVARQVQTALLPRIAGQVKAELDVGVYHKQLTEVGGDYYDFFDMPGNRFAIGVFDISGHGVSAALIMAFLKAQFSQVLDRIDTPKGIVEWVNKHSYDFLREVRRYATVNFVVFQEDRVRYVSGGGYGYLLRRGEERVFAKRDPFIGLRLKEFEEHELPFEKGDLLALYTDGIVESQSADGRDYGVSRLNRLIAQHAEEPAQAIVDRCVADYEGFRSADSDDITLLVLRRRK